jgi:hypothetical protein
MTPATLGLGTRLGRGPVKGRVGMQRRGSRRRPARWLGDNCQSSAQTGPVGSGQLRLARHSVECGLVGCSRAWWNDRQNDQLSKRRACPTAPAREGHWLAARAVRPTGQAGGGSAIRPWAPLDKRPAQASRYRPSSRVAVQSGFEDANSCSNVDTSSKQRVREYVCPRVARIWRYSTMATMAILCHRPYQRQHIPSTADRRFRLSRQAGFKAETIEARSLSTLRSSW